MRQLATASLSLVSILCLTGCLDSRTPAEKAAKKEKKAPEPVTGLTAYYRMYSHARTWATDLQGYHLQSIALPELPAKGGKYPAWRATFVSEIKRAQKTYSFSAIEVEGLHEGVFAGPEESYTPGGNNLPFISQALKKDSPEILATAMKKGEDYTKKHLNLPITVLVERTKRFGNNPTWRVVWGTSVATSNFSIYIDASTGEYLQTMH